MAVKKLNRLEVQDLLNRYYSELNKLEYQVRQVNSTISDLETRLSRTDATTPLESPAATAATSAPKKSRRGRPRKSTTTAKATTTPTTKKKRGRGRPKKTETAASTGTAAATKESPKKRKRGRPKKSESKAVKTRSTPKKRGRKPGSKIGGYRLSDWDTFVLDSLKDASKILIHSDFQEKAQDWVKANNIKADEDTIKGKISRSIHKLANKRKSIKKTSYEGRGFAYGLESWFNPDGSLKKKYSR